MISYYNIKLIFLKEYLKKDLLIGNDIKETGIPYNYGINTIENLINLYV